MTDTYIKITAFFDDWKNEAMKRFKEAEEAEKKQHTITENKLSQIRLEAHIAADSVIPAPTPGLTEKFEDVAASLDVICYNNGLQPKFIKTYTELAQKSSEALQRFRTAETLFGTSEMIKAKINKAAANRKEYGAILKSFFEMRKEIAANLIKSDTNGNITGKYTIDENDDVILSVAKNLTEIVSPHLNTVNDAEVPDILLRNTADNYKTITGKDFFADYSAYMRIKTLGYPIAFEEYDNLATTVNGLTAVADEIKKDKKNVLSPSHIKSSIIELFKNAAMNPGFIYDFKKDFPDHSGNPAAYDIHAYERLRQNEKKAADNRKSASKNLEELYKITTFLHSAQKNPVVRDAVISTMSGVSSYSASHKIPDKTKDNCIKTMQAVITALRKPHIDKINKYWEGRKLKP